MRHSQILLQNLKIFLALRPADASQKLLAPFALHVTSGRGALGSSLHGHRQSSDQTPLQVLANLSL